MKEYPPLTLSQYQSGIAQLRSLTESEFRLDDYLQHHFNEIPFHGIVDIAQNAGVSKATIGRFLARLGYTGYAEFRRNVEAALLSQKMDSPYDVATRTSPVPELTTPQRVANFSNSIGRLLAEFQQSLNINNLEEFTALLLDEKRHLYVVGPSSSLAMATHFVTLIKYFRHQVTLLSLDSGELPKSLLSVSPQDVLVVFSYYRFNNMALRVAGWFRNHQATVVLVTNSESNPYGKYCNLQFILPSETGSVFKSRLTGFAFTELVLHMTFASDKGLGNFAELEELFSYFETFSPGV